MTWNEFVEYSHALNPFSIFLRLFLASVFGGIIGINRARKQRPAGFRTHMLVCLGAAVVMLTGQFMHDLYGASDPARLGAQVVSGIGFLGAGTIVVNRRNQVLGLTTAAGLWASACIGLAIGSGFYSGGIIASLFIFFVVIVLHDVDSLVRGRSKHLEMFIEFESTDTLTSLLHYMTQSSIKVRHIELIEARNTQNHVATLVQITLPKSIPHDEVAEHLRAIEGVNFLEIL